MEQPIELKQDSESDDVDATPIDNIRYSTFVHDDKNLYKITLSTTQETVCDEDRQVTNKEHAKYHGSHMKVIDIKRYIGPKWATCLDPVEKYPHIYLAGHYVTINSFCSKEIATKVPYYLKLKDESVRNGIQLSYDKDGNIIYKSARQNGKRNGITEVYNINGQLIAKLNYVNGQLKGESEIYLDRTYIITSTERSSEILYYKTGEELILLSENKIPKIPWVIKSLIEDDNNLKWIPSQHTSDLCIIS